MGKRVVIVGGVAAGMKTAARLRRLDAEAEIIVLERGPQLSYGACGFPYFISGEVKSMDSFDHTPQGALRDSNYFAAVKGIDARCGCNVQKIDRVQKCVHYMEKGELKQLSYDVLVLATGSTPVKLPLPNADASGIHSFWFPWDVEAVDKEIAEGGVKDVVIIGAGFIGLELAEAFVRRGLHTSVLEQQDRLLPQLLDEDMAALLLRDTKNPLLDIYLQEKAGGFTKKADKLSVNLAEVVKDGTQLTIEKKRKRKAAQEEQSSHGMSSADEAGKINLNTASAEQLMKLSGIGESKAAQIISYREKNGAFKKIEDIMNITGIKEGVFGKIKDDITV